CDEDGAWSVADDAFGVVAQQDAAHRVARAVSDHDEVRADFFGRHDRFAVGAAEAQVALRELDAGFPGIDGRCSGRDRSFMRFSVVLIDVSKWPFRYAGSG
ncbi:MAG: hypothetical protein WA989_01550, partial [Henriciella sp.]